MKKVFLFFAVALTFAACGPKTSETKQEEAPVTEEAVVVEEVTEAADTTVVVEEVVAPQ
jgi:hypothetical protein